MTAVFRSQWLLLNRARLWVSAGTAAIAVAVLTTTVSLVLAEPASTAREGLTIESLAGAGGATTATIGALAFGGLLVLATFTSTVNNELTRGTLRTALLQRPGRGTFFAGKLGALFAVTGIVLVIALVAGTVTAAVVAPGQGIATTDWFGLEALGQALADLGRLAAWALGWAVLGTTLGIVCRSTPIALAIGIVWFGPIENVLADNLELGRRWFPGQLLRAVVAPDSPGTVAGGTAGRTLLAYGVVLGTIATVALHRRDITS